jgi:hypothetical protein
MARIRILCSLSILLFATAGIAVLFWQQELKYHLPTPVPSNYHFVAVGSLVDVSTLPRAHSFFLHFYNPDCPCSRFNARHLKSIIHSYADSVSFVIVVSGEEAYRKASEEFNDVKIVVDQHGALARACGVYATPQAAIIDADGKLYYRGNYNKSRYCTSRATNFAELALIALLSHQPSPVFGLLATQSYGCVWEPEKNEDQLVTF